MEVGHGFTGVAPIVEHQAEAGFCQPLFFGYLCGLEQKVSQYLVVFGFCLGDARDRLFGNDQDMDRSLRLNVSKRDYQVVLIDQRRRHFSRGNFFK